MPPDWTDLELDLRIDDESRYVDSAVALSQVNAQAYSDAEWHWRLLVAHSFGHAAAAETVKGVLAKLDADGVDRRAARSPRCARAAPRSCRCGAGRRASARSSASAARSSGAAVALLMARVVASPPT